LQCAAKAQTAQSCRPGNKKATDCQELEASS
jgi:hypothetical protein